jgi:hypothetical protein
MNAESCFVDSIAGEFGPVARELYATWWRLPRQSGVPDRASFDPMAIARFLPVVSLLQRFGDAEWRFRLVGTELERRWARSLTGRNIIELVAPALTAALRRELAEVSERPCGSWSRRRLEFDSGRLATVETLRLPLRAADGSVSLILSCSGELPERNGRGSDHGHSIVTLLQHRFFDIGGGVATDSLVADAVAVA